MQYLSKQHFVKVQEELETLRKKRLEVADALRRAKEEGDLSENFAYAAARDEQDRVERRIFELEELLNSASIVDENAKSDTVVVGSVVTVEKDKKKVVYTIVAPDEADPAILKISNESPLGQAIIGKKVGDKVTVETPGGSFGCKIVKIG